MRFSAEKKIYRLSFLVSIEKLISEGFVAAWLVHPDQLLTSGRRTEQRRGVWSGLVLLPPGLPNGLLSTWSIAPPPSMASLQSFAFWFLVFFSWTQSESYTVEEISDNSENQRLVGDARSNLGHLHTHKYRDSDSEHSKLQRSSHFTRSRLKNPRKWKCKL